MELWGVEGWAGKDSELTWNTPWRGGQFQDARAENTSARTWMRGIIPKEHPPKGLCGVKTCLESDPNFSRRLKSTGVDGLTRSPVAEVHMSESSLAPKLTLQQFSALLEAIKPVVAFGAVA